MSYFIGIFFMSLSILTHYNGGATDDATTTPSCSIRLSSDFRGPPGIPGKQGKQYIEIKKKYTRAKLEISHNDNMMTNNSFCSISYRSFCCSFIRYIHL